MCKGQLVGLWDYSLSKESFGIVCSIDKNSIAVQVKNDIVTVPKSYVYSPGEARPTSPLETVRKYFWTIQGRWCRLDVHGNPVIETELPGLNTDVF